MILFIFFSILSIFYNAGFFSITIITKYKYKQMWKKIGAINNNINDNKSSRSRDQNNQYQPFSQMSKIRLSQSQIGYEQSQYFCPNYLSKKKSPQAKYLSQTKIKTEKQLNKLYTDNLDKYKETTLKKKIKAQSFQEMKKRISQLHIFQDNQQHSPETPQFQNNEDQFLQNHKTSTSIQFQQHTLRHYGSSPQLKSFNSDLIVKQQQNRQQIQQPSQKIQKKKEAVQKLDKLKDQQKKLKNQVKQQIKNFQQDFSRIKIAIKQKMLQQIKKEQKKASQIKQQINQNKQMKFQKNDVQNIIKGTTQFKNKLQMYDTKKMELIQKYKLLKGK